MCLNMLVGSLGQRPSDPIQVIIQILDFSSYTHLKKFLFNSVQVLFDSCNFCG